MVTPLIVDYEGCHKFLYRPDGCPDENGIVGGGAAPDLLINIKKIFRFD